MMFPPKDVPGLIVVIGSKLVNKENPADKYKVIEKRWVRDGMLGSGHNEYLLRRARKSKKTVSQEFWASEEFIKQNAEAA